MLRREFLKSLATASTQMSTTGPDTPRLAHFDELMHGIIRRQDLPGGSLSLAKDGRLVYARGFGMASKENRVPARPGTLFGVASVSKAITAAAIVKLVDQGRVGLEDRAFDILRARPNDPRAHKITLRQLLTHSAGYKEQPDDAWVAHRMNIPVAKLREEHLVASFIGRHLAYDPGTDEEYSNFGFVVLGVVAERVVGIPVGPAIHRLVFDPMGIRHAYYGHGGPHRPDTARPYDDQGKLLPSIDIAGGSAGGLIISTVDLVRFLAALRGARGRPFLSQGVYQEMIAPPTPPRKSARMAPGMDWDGMAFVRLHAGHPIQRTAGCRASARSSVTWPAAWTGRWPLTAAAMPKGISARTLRR